MGLRRSVQPRHGSDVLGPGCLPRRAIAASPAPWRRPLAALVLAGGIGAFGLNTTPAAAAEPVSSNTQRCEQSTPRRAAAEQTEKRSSRTDRSKERTTPRRAAAETTSRNTSKVASLASATSTSERSTTSTSERSTTTTEGAAAPLAKGTYRVSAKFGATGNWSRYHTGQDFSAATGTPVHAVVSGTVVKGNAGSWAGNHVAIRAADGSATLYAHLDSTDVKVGQQVTAGQKIGEVGSTGRSFGSHLHFEYYPAGKTPGDVYSATNPMTYLSSLGITM